MTLLVDSVLVAVVMVDLAVLATGRLGTKIRFVAVQGGLLGLFTLSFARELGPVAVVLLAVGVIALKGIVYPWQLARIGSRVRYGREMAPLVGFNRSVVVGFLAVIGGLFVGPTVPGVPADAPGLAVPVAIATMVTGFFLCVARRKAFSQVLGYIVLENGMFLLSITLAAAFPLLIEFGSLLEVFAAIFIMGIAVDRISKEFGVVDVDQLTQLQG